MNEKAKSTDEREDSRLVLEKRESGTLCIEPTGFKELRPNATEKNYPCHPIQSLTLIIEVTGF